MLRFIEMELFKLKGSRTLLITLIGALIVPIINTIIEIYFKGGNLITTINDSINISLTIFSIIFGTIIINYLFTIDLDTHTIKSIIPLPVSKEEYLNGKIITLLLWMLFLTIITIIASVILYTIVGMPGFDLGLLLKTSGKFLLGTFILYLTLLPLAFVITAIKNHSATLVLAILFIFLNISSSMYDKLLYLPWNIPVPLIEGVLTFSTNIGWLIVIATGITGYILTYIVINKRDIPL